MAVDLDVKYLEAEGVVKVVGLKNRYLTEGSDLCGYRDVNYSLLFNGSLPGGDARLPDLVVELQVWVGGRFGGGGSGGGLVAGMFCTYPPQHHSFRFRYRASTISSSPLTKVTGRLWRHATSIPTPPPPPPLPSPPAMCVRWDSRAIFLRPFQRTPTTCLRDGFSGLFWGYVRELWRLSGNPY